MRRLRVGAVRRVQPHSAFAPRHVEALLTSPGAAVASVADIADLFVAKADWRILQKGRMVASGTGTDKRSIPTMYAGGGNCEIASIQAIGTGLGAAVSSFLFFATGALIPVLPYLFGLTGTTAVITAAALVGIALLATGVVVGLLSGAPPLRRALRQLMIGYGAAAVTYLLGLLVGGGLG